MSYYSDFAIPTNATAAAKNKNKDLTLFVQNYARSLVNQQLLAQKTLNKSKTEPLCIERTMFGKNGNKKAPEGLKYQMFEFLIRHGL